MEKKQKKNSMHEQSANKVHAQFTKSVEAILLKCARDYKLQGSLLKSNLDWNAHAKDISNLCQNKYYGHLVGS